ncbi:MAG: hypothetical protein P0Y53_10205 [Candidatus Pseudobacter hemicellulosilyticus]|uniref:DUF2784 family protein n=1 Tax=Candidatus Pseudobacter hemicellulosilyticus TaxID=3121375 RepID=A0AAJ5X0K0_9BACT|nr:MAG: hypothetical protein P0Y53_10205 [Pseudobacter sp.]
MLIIKIVHTLIWLFFNVVIFYMLYAVSMDKIDRWLWIGYGLLTGEILALISCRFFCPLTLLARRYAGTSTPEKDNFDIFLPLWLARYNKHIYGSILGLIMVLTVYRLLT